MQLNTALSHAFGEIREGMHRTVEHLGANALAWRPSPAANSIAWLIWHTARVEDSHVAEIAAREQVWVEGGWARQLGLPADYDDTGYGHSAAQVGQIKPGPGPLLRYVDAVTQMVRDYLQGADEADFDRIIDRSYDPPVSAGVRFLSVIGDAYQHLGQAGYVRGLQEHGSRNG